MLKNFIVILWISANFLASLFGFTLKPISVALDALARVTSVSVITPILDSIIFGATSACSIFSIALLSAALDPWTSLLIIIGSSFGRELLSNAESLLTKICVVFLVLLCSIL